VTTYITRELFAHYWHFLEFDMGVKKTYHVKEIDHFQHPKTQEITQARQFVVRSPVRDEIEVCSYRQEERA
jgi:hypothetical protein